MLAVRAMKHWQMCQLPSEMVAIITDVSRTMGCVQKMDVDEAVRQESGVETLYEFIGSNEFKIECVHGIAPRIHVTSTCYQAQAVASEPCNKSLTRNSLKSFSLPPTASASDSSTKRNLVSSTAATNNFRSKHMKDATRSSIKKKFQRRNYSKSAKVKGDSL